MSPSRVVVAFPTSSCWSPPTASSAVVVWLSTSLSWWWAWLCRCHVALHFVFVVEALLLLVVVVWLFVVVVVVALAVVVVVWHSSSFSQWRPSSSPYGSPLRCRRDGPPRRRFCFPSFTSFPSAPPPRFPFLPPFSSLSFPLSPRRFPAPPGFPPPLPSFPLPPLRHFAPLRRLHFNPPPACRFPPPPRQFHPPCRFIFPRRLCFPPRVVVISLLLVIIPPNLLSLYPITFFRHQVLRRTSMNRPTSLWKGRGGCGSDPSSCACWWRW
jgi:hypothetical protein